jgi:hypothetical protein
MPPHGQAGTSALIEAHTSRRMATDNKLKTRRLVDQGARWKLADIA